LLSTSAWAIGIDHPHTLSQLLRAEVSLTQADQTSLDKIRVTLGDDQAYLLPVGEAAEVFHRFLVPEIKTEKKIAFVTKVKETSKTLRKSLTTNQKNTIHWGMILFYSMILAAAIAVYRFRQYILP
jgi:hypothetical protein